MRRLSENDLQTLQTQDSFMYHSIPAVHKATITLQEVDNAETFLSQESSVVTRKSRLSTECHMSLMMKEFFGDEDFLDSNFEAFEFEFLRSFSPNYLAGSRQSDNDNTREQQPDQ
ncbi:hypothetical protein ACHAW5_007293 [Stephanodiscus triporus]|uniref:Uncharacterized protein n=1 Tax=Stephanodiscus triporus TaxID=2934178 RepID=A0ABD3NCJ9_9STRA